MKRILALALTVFLLLPLFAGCSTTGKPGGVVEPHLRLADFVGVWTCDEKTVYYRFTPTGMWYRYNELGEVLSKGKVVFDGNIFTLTDEGGNVVTLTALENSGFTDGDGVAFVRTDSPSSLISSQQYGHFFYNWFEESNLNGNILTITEPDVWVYKDPNGVVLHEGNFYAYADEEDILYLHAKEDGEFFGRLKLSEKDLILETNQQDNFVHTVFSLEENSTKRRFYFKEKKVECDYVIGSGDRLLRNGGAAYNDSHDYKKMPVTCNIEIVDDTVDENQLRHVMVNINYIFYRRDFPILSGSRFYNSVRFSQYDYYTGQLFYLDDSTGDEILSCNWVTEHDGKSYDIQCEFSSKWEYSQSEDVMMRFQGTYQLTIPQDYDGFVFCLRPVFNSYSAQVSASISPEEGTLMLEDLGDDVDKAIFCRLNAKNDVAFSAFSMGD